MQEREDLIAELWSRLASVSGVNYTARNPKEPPDVGVLPSITFFELEDIIVERRRRGAKPEHRRKLTLVIEAFIVGSTESLSSKELGVFVGLIKSGIYEDGVTLGGLCSEFLEIEAGRVLRPEVGGSVIGIGLGFEILYTEAIT